MRSRRTLSRLSRFTLAAFLFFIAGNPILAGCGGGGGGEEGTQIHLAYTTPLATTTDDSGVATIDSSNVAKQIQVTVKNTAGRPVSGLDIEYADTVGGVAGQIIISDPNEIYQSALISLTAEDLASDGAAGVVATTPDGVRLQAELTLAAAVVYLIITVLTAKAVYEIGTGLYELYGDPPTVSLMGSYVFSCISTDQLLTLMNIGINAIGLITAGSASAAAQGVAAGTMTAWEAFGKDIAVDGAVTIGTRFAEYLSDEKGFDRSQKYCTLLVANATLSTRYESAAQIVGRACTTAADCGSASTASSTSGTVAVIDATGVTTFTGTVEPHRSMIDGDKDGYAPIDGDCDDYMPYIYPGQLEICGDGVDQDCDGSDMACSGTLGVNIISPPKTTDFCPDTQISGVCSGNVRGLTVMANITGGEDNHAYIIVNGRVVPAQLTAGLEGDQISSNSPALLKCVSSGWVNKIQVVAVDKYSQTALDEVEWACNGGATDMLIMLTWDTCDTDLDLYVQEPSGAIQSNSGDWAAGSETAQAGVVYGYETNCYGPVYYAILEGAPSGNYAIRVHHKEGTQFPQATLRIINDERFDRPYTVTQTLGPALSSASGSGNFYSTDGSWGTTISVAKTPGGYWMSGRI